MLNLLKKAYEHSPIVLKRLYASIPFGLRMGPVYRETRRFLTESERWPRQKLKDYQNERLRELIQHTYKNVPYYHRIFTERGLRPDDVSTVADLQKLPLLTREDVNLYFDDLVARNVVRRTTHYTATGGTTGEPLRFRINNSAYAAEWAFMMDQWARIGYDPSCRKIGLREFAYGEKNIYHFDPIYNEIRLSTIHLSDENVQSFLDLSRRFGARYINAYPSAITIFAQCLKRTGLSMGSLAGIMVGSEKLYDWQRELLTNTFGCRVFSWYGQTEKVILAGECEKSSLYHAYPQYGCLELVAEDGGVIDQPGVCGELVGTGFLNSVMPFIRYRTGDYAMYAEGSCSCGRAYPLITGVEGRRNQDIFVGNSGQLITATAFSVSDWTTFRSVRAFQFEQEKAGHAMLKILPSDNYSDEDATRLVAMMKKWAGESLEFHVVPVAELQRTPRGKVAFLVQKIDLKQLNNARVCQVHRRGTTGGRPSE